MPPEYIFMKIKKKNTSQIVIFVIALVHVIISFFTDKLIFSFPQKTDESAYRFFMIDYPVCKIILFVALFYLYTFIYKAFICKEDNTVRKIVKCAAPYLFIMIPVCIFKLPKGYLTNDETIILDNALKLTHYTWFTYITAYYYIVSIMAIPFKYAPILVKLIIEYVSVGYIVFRFKNYFENRTNNNITGDAAFAWESESFVEKYHLREKILRGSRLRIKHDAKRHEIKYYWISYVLFLLYPVIAYTTSAHRLPIYYLLYLVMVVTLIFDCIEKNELTASKCFWLILLGAVLTHFRTEGIYLAVLLPILMFLTYKNIRNIKAAAVVIVMTLVLQALVYIPQNVIGMKDLSASATDRMKPFYGYTIVNMMRNGLDREKNAEDLAIVDKYISLDAIDKINDYYGDINYEDSLILFEGEYYGVREEADMTEFFNYAIALKNIFKNNIGVFIKTRIGAFVYAAIPYHINFEPGLKGFVKGLFSIFKSLSYNIFIPFVSIIVICLYSLFRKRWFTFFLTGGLIAHWFIVFILAPASYFKYYFPVYTCGYLYLILLILQAVYNKKALKKITFIM